MLIFFSLVKMYFKIFNIIIIIATNINFFMMQEARKMRNAGMHYLAGRTQAKAVRIGIHIPAYFQNCYNRKISFSVIIASFFFFI